MIAELWRCEVARRWKNFAFFGKTTPRENFQNFVQKGFIASPIDVLCSNFVKYERREIGKIVRCLPDKKQNFASLSSSRYCADRTQNLSESAPPARMCSDCSRFYPNRLTFGGIIPERVNIVRARVRSESSIRLEPSFEPRNDGRNIRRSKAEEIDSGHLLIGVDFIDSQWDGARDGLARSAVEAPAR